MTCAQFHGRVSGFPKQAIDDMRIRLGGGLGREPSRSGVVRFALKATLLATLLADLSASAWDGRR